MQENCNTFCLHIHNIGEYLSDSHSLSNKTHACSLCLTAIYGSGFLTVGNENAFMLCGVILRFKKSKCCQQRKLFQSEKATASWRLNGLLVFLFCTFK